MAVLLGGVFPLAAQDMDSMVEPIVAVQHMLWGETDAVVEDAEAILVRMHHGLSMTISTTGLEPGNVYTIWWVIFNAPENCSDSVCGPDDVFLMNDEGQFILTDDGLNQPNVAGREMTQVSSLRATGNIGYEDGTSVFKAHLPIGDTTDDIGWGPALLNSMESRGASRCSFTWPDYPGTAERTTHDGMGVDVQTRMIVLLAKIFNWLFSTRHHPS